MDARTGTDMAGVQVSVRGTALRTGTGADGSYALSGVPAGVQTLEASDGLGGTAKLVTVRPGATTAANLALHRPDTVAVRFAVLNAVDGSPLMGAQVVAGSSQGSTDASGRLVIANVEARAHRVDVALAGFASVSTVLYCTDQVEYVVGLVPSLATTTDELFQERSEQAHYAAAALRDAIVAFRQAGTTASRGPVPGNRAAASRAASLEAASLERVLQNGRALAAVLANITEFDVSTRSRGMFSWLGLGANAKQMGDAVDSIEDVKVRVMAGQDVPQVDEWLGQNSVAGYSSLRSVRDDWADDEGIRDLYLHRILVAYMTANSESEFHTGLVEPGKEIVLDSYDEAGSNLIGDGLNAIWSGFGTLVTEIKDAWRFISKKGDQFVWGIETSIGKVVLYRTRPGVPGEFPAGTYSVAVSNGVALKPSYFAGVAIPNGATRTLALDPGGASGRNIAVTPRGYDDIGALLTSLGRPFQYISQDAVNAWSGLSAYDVVCVNCASNVEPLPEQAAARLRQFVHDGGVLYCSDWAYTVIQSAFPDQITFFDEPATGNAQSVTASVVDPGLSAFLGTTSLPIEFDLSGWVPIKGVADNVRVGLRASVTGLPSRAPGAAQGPGAATRSRSPVSGGRSLGVIPLSITFAYGSGRVHFTSFHNEVQASDDIKRILLYEILTQGRRGTPRPGN